MTDSSVSSFRKKKNRIAGMFIINPRMKYVLLEVLCEEEVAPFFFRRTISFSSNESSSKHENIALKITMTKQFASCAFFFLSKPSPR